MKRVLAFLSFSVIGICGCKQPDAPPPTEKVSPPPVAAPAPAPVPPPVAIPSPAPQVESVTVAVEYLISTISSSTLTFIRNGDKHTGAEAAKHIRSKYDYFQKDIKTAEDFIEKAATKSQLSGKPYLVVLEDGKQVPLADWLTSKLAEWRASRPQ